MLQGIMIATATGGTRHDATYRYLRQELMSDEQIKRLLPDFVRTHRDLDAFWPFIKNAARGYCVIGSPIHTGGEGLCRFVRHHVMPN